MASTNIEVSCFNILFNSMIFGSAETLLDTEKCEYVRIPFQMFVFFPFVILMLIYS